MKSFIRVLTLMLTLAVLLSAVAVSASAAEFEDYYEPLSETLGDVDNDFIVTVKDATAIQKYLAKYIELSENALELADVSGSGDVTISDATLIQKFLAEIIVYFPVAEFEPDAICKVGQAIDVEFATDDEFIIQLIIQEDGFYEMVATPSAGSEIFYDVTKRGVVDPDIFFSETDGEASYCFGYFESGIYDIYMTTWGYENVVATFKVSKADDMCPFDKEDATELKMGDKIEIPAGESKAVYKVDLNTVRGTIDAYAIYTEGGNTKVNITGYTEMYSVYVGALTLEDGGNVMLYVADDYMNDWIYILVEAYEESGEFTLCCDSVMELYKESAVEIELDSAAEILTEEFSLSTDDEELTFCFAEATFKFTPAADGYYSFAYNCQKPISIVHGINRYDGYYEDDMMYFFRDAEDGQTMDVRFLEAGVDYYLDVIAETAEEAAISLTVSTSTEAAYNEVRAEDEEWFEEESTDDEVEYKEIKLGEAVEVDLSMPENGTEYYSFTAEEDCEIVLFSENSVDAYIEIYTDEDGIIYWGDDISLVESFDFAALGTMSAGETCYIHLTSNGEDADNYTFMIVNSSDYVPLV